MSKPSRGYTTGRNRTDFDTDLRDVLTLSERISASGRKYFYAIKGRRKILLRQANRRASNGDPQWTLSVQRLGPVPEQSPPLQPEPARKTIDRLPDDLDGPLPFVSGLSENWGRR